MHFEQRGGAKNARGIERAGRPADRAPDDGRYVVQDMGGMLACDPVEFRVDRGGAARQIDSEIAVAGLAIEFGECLFRIADGAEKAGDDIDQQRGSRSPRRPFDACRGVRARNGRYRPAGAARARC